MKMRTLSRYICCCLVGLLALSAHAQVQVEATIDTVAILIGEQARMTVGVTARRGQQIQFPSFQPSQMLTAGVEVVDVSQADTLPLENNLQKVTKVFTLTSFDEKLYPLPGMEVKVDGKGYRANNLALKVMTLDVDTLHPEQFFPPKSVQDNPFKWSEWSGVFWWSVVLLLLALAVYYLMVRLAQNKPVISRIRIVKRMLPHQKALKAIDQLKAEHMVTSEDQKAYYTRLTDTLRQYIKERFGFNATEMTTSEIIAHLHEAGDEQMIDELRELFVTADLVKFAKYSTLINENDLNLVNAVNFIDQTKVENMPTEERIVPTLTDDDKRTRKNRVTIKGLIAAVLIAAAALLAYIVYAIYQLTY